MNLQLHFNSDGTVQNLTFILGTRKGSKIGLLSRSENVNISDSLDDAPQISFDVHKYDNGNITPYYNDLTTFKLVYIPEADTWFEAIVEENESDEGAVKHVTLTRLGEAELEQIHVYGLNINTEDSIIYDENFKPTVLYDPNDSAHSLADRILSYAPHYHVGYVAPTVRNIQRTFSFNDTSVVDCFKDVAEEESLFIIYDSSDNNGQINRTVSIYDVMSNCNVCNYRGLFTHTCPKCGSTSITEGYGEDTTIMVSSDSLGNDLNVSTNEEAIANCYHLQAGDDIMTAAVRQCNPNGTGYIWNFTNEMYNEMSTALSTAIQNYNVLYNQYMTTHAYLSSAPTDYNTLITKYKAIDPTLDVDTISNIIGYPALIKAWYDALDFYYFLKTSLMPSVSTDNITAADVVADIYTGMNNQTVAVGNINNLTLAAASTAVMNNARLIANTIYEITVQTQSLNGTTWTGTLMATNFYDKDDTAVTQMMTVTVNDNLQAYVSGKVMKTLYNTTQGESTVVAMYNQTLAQVQQNLHYYSLDELNNINKSFNGAIEILSKFKADQSSSELYNVIYVPTKQKLDAVQAEMVVREGEVNLVNNFVNTLFNTYITGTQTALNFENYLGAANWVELNSFRREASFSDNNYVSTTFRRKFSYSDSQFISDSLTNSEIVQRAYEFLVQAEQKMAENNKYSYQISSSLKNLLVIPDFNKLRSMFKCGNWMRVKAKDGALYKLRLISYEMNFDNPESLTVSFSDVSNTSNVRAAQQIIAKSVDLVKNQKKYSNDLGNRFTTITDDIQCDYVYNDSYVGGDIEDNIELVEDELVTSFNVLNGLIQGKISQEEAESLIQQTLDKITLSVSNNAQGKYSTVELLLDGVHITTSGQITLGGTVVFTSNLTDGTTEISGDNIKTGNIQSHNYEYTTEYYYMIVVPQGDEDPSEEQWYELSNGSYFLTQDTYIHNGKTYYEQLPNYFADAGTQLDLTHGNIRTPGFYVDGESGDAYFKGTVNAEGGYIGDYPIIITNDGGGSMAGVSHANHSWKLRSGAINSDDVRYYAYMTSNKNFIVSNSELEKHSETNDVTDNCQIGSYKYPWGKGYFKNLRVWEEAAGTIKTHNVIPEGLPLTLESTNWEQHPNGYYTQTQRVNGMKGDIYLYIATNDAVDLDLVYKHNIEVDSVQNNRVTFLAQPVNGSYPASDIDIILLVEDYVLSNIEAPELNASFNEELNQLSCLWSTPRDDSKFITWQKDELIIEKCIDEQHPGLPESWQQVLVVPASGETPFEPDEFVDTPLVIGSVSQ